MTARSWSRQGSGMGGVVVVLVLVAVLAGLIYGFWDDISARFAGPERIDEPEGPAGPAEPEVPPPPPPAGPAADKRKVEKPASKPRPAVRVSEARKRKARQARAEAEAALKALDFKRAAMLYNTAAIALEGTDGASDCKALADRALTFGGLTSKLDLNPEAEGDLAILRRDIGDMEVVIIDETPDSYIIARKGGIRGEIPKHEVRSIERVGKDRYRRRALAEIEKAEREMKERSGVAYYVLAERAFKEGLSEETLDYLGKAYALEGEDLPARIRRYEAGQLLYRAHWSESTGRARTARMWCMKLERLYPDVPELVEEGRELRARIAEREAAERDRQRPRPTVKIMVRERSSRSAGGGSRAARGGAEEEVTGVQIDEVRSTSGRHAKTIDKMNKLFKKAMDDYVAGRPGNPNSNRHLTLAARGFDQVVALCERVLRTEPRNTAVKSRQADASRYAYHARKMKTLAFGR